MLIPKNSGKATRFLIYTLMKKEEITITLVQKIAELSSINSVRRFLKHKHLRHLQNLRDKKLYIKFVILNGTKWSEESQCTY
jgi:hypothetical protein